MNFAKKVLKKLIPYSGRRKLISVTSLLFGAYSQRSFSQEGEDLILRRLFEDQSHGFYVDIGAHHPKLFSNTYFFYRRGWRGINIDAAPGSMKPFNVFRSRDINIESAISSRTEPIYFSIFNEPALNSFYANNSQGGNSEYKESKRVELKPRTLKSILDEYLPDGQVIDFLSVDVEGEDINVLKSNDWDKFRPKLIAIEERDFDIQDPEKSKIFTFLKTQGYILKAKTLNTLLFVLDSSEKIS